MSVDSEQTVTAPPDWLDRLVGRLPHVRQAFVEEVREMSREELQRRILIGSDWQGAFACCLNGIKEIAVIPGGGIDNCRMPDDLRRIVEQLVAECPLTWEDDWRGRPKTPNALELSHSPVSRGLQEEKNK